MEHKEVAKQVEAIKRQRNINTLKAAEVLMMGKFDQSYPFRLICECYDAACRDLITVKNDGYRVIDRKNNVFYIKPGHEHNGIEKILHKDEHFYVVEKYGGPITPITEQHVNVTLKQLEKVQATKSFDEYYLKLMGNLA